MRKPAWIWLLVVGLIVVLLAIPAAPSQAWSHHGGGRVFVGVGVGVWPGFWWGPPAPWYWYPAPYYYPPQVIVQQPQMYIQQVPAPSAPTAYWYYCQSAQEYYPQVQSCPEPWVPVQPRNP